MEAGKITLRQAVMVLNECHFGDVAEAEDAIRKLGFGNMLAQGEPTPTIAMRSAAMALKKQHPKLADVVPLRGEEEDDEAFTEKCHDWIAAHGRRLTGNGEFLLSIHKASRTI